MVFIGLNFIRLSLLLVAVFLIVATLRSRRLAPIAATILLAFLVVIPMLLWGTLRVRSHVRHDALQQEALTQRAEAQMQRDLAAAAQHIERQQQHVRARQQAAERAVQEAQAMVQRAQQAARGRHTLSMPIETHRTEAAYSPPAAVAYSAAPVEYQDPESLIDLGQATTSPPVAAVVQSSSANPAADAVRTALPEQATESVDASVEQFLRQIDARLDRLAELVAHISGEINQRPAAPPQPETAVSPGRTESAAEFARVFAAELGQTAAAEDGDSAAAAVIYTDAATSDEASAEAASETSPSPAGPGEPPAWIDLMSYAWDGQVYRACVTVGPYATHAELDARTDEELQSAFQEFAAWYRGQLGHQTSWWYETVGFPVDARQLRQECVKQPFYETETPNEILGEPWPVRYVLMEFDGKLQRQLQKHFQEVRSLARTAQLGLGAAGLIGCLATLFGYLKLNEITGRRFRWRLRLAAVTGFAAVFFLVVLALDLLPCAS